MQTCKKKPDTNQTERKEKVLTIKDMTRFGGSNKELDSNKYSLDPIY